MDENYVTPEQFAVFLAALGFACLLAAWFWYGMYGTGPVAFVVRLRVVRWCAAYVKQLLFGADDDAEPVHVSVPHTSTRATGTSNLPNRQADTNAENGDIWAMPRLSRHLSDRELITLLAAQRTAAGKPRFSANKIHALVGGGRKEVLDQVREVQNPPQFRPLTPEQQMTRTELGLE